MGAYEVNFLLPKQTPTKEHLIFIAEHTTAICCKGYLQKWYRIEKGGAF